MPCTKENSIDTHDSFYSTTSKLVLTQHSIDNMYISFICLIKSTQWYLIMMTSVVICHPCHVFNKQTKTKRKVKKEGNIRIT